MGYDCGLYLLLRDFYYFTFPFFFRDFQDWLMMIAVMVEEAEWMWLVVVALGGTKEMSFILVKSIDYFTFPFLDDFQDLMTEAAAVLEVGAGRQNGSG